MYETMYHIHWLVDITALCLVILKASAHRIQCRKYHSVQSSSLSQTGCPEGCSFIAPNVLPRSVSNDLPYQPARNALDVELSWARSRCSKGVPAGVVETLINALAQAALFDGVLSLGSRVEVWNSTVLPKMWSSLPRQNLSTPLLCLGDLRRRCSRWALYFYLLWLRRRELRDAEPELRSSVLPPSQGVVMEGSTPQPHKPINRITPQGRT